MVEKFILELRPYEYPKPLNSQESDTNNSLHLRLKNVLPIGEEGEVFEDSAFDHKIYVHIRNGISGEKPPSNNVFDSHYMSLSYESPVSSIIYRFNGRGMAIKEVSRKDANLAQQRSFSALDKGDYSDVDSALKLIESGKFIVARRE